MLVREKSLFKPKARCVTDIWFLWTVVMQFISSVLKSVARSLIARYVLNHGEVYCLKAAMTAK